jgi:exodeoxyribonuclease V alpha subunit
VTALDARTALRAGPVLRAFNRAGVLSAADVQVAGRLGRLAGEPDERVLLAVALAVRAVRSGSVCVALDDLDALCVPDTEDGEPTDGAVVAGDLPWPADEPWRAAIGASPLVAGGPGRVDPAGGRLPDPPVRWVDGRLYLDRYWRDEQVVRTEVDARLAAGALAAGPALARTVRRLFPGEGDGPQRVAATTAALSLVTVVTGGPGTGKTTTVARLLAVLQDVAGPGLRVGLAAPTGKAAARLQEAVRSQVAGLDPADRRRVGSPEATTVHRLLGWKPGSSTRFRHDRQHRLPHDVVVVDETSMVSLPLMARLLEALRPQARLVLVGDPDQLASVEAGAVLGDLVARPAVADALPAAVAGVLPDDVRAGDAAALRNGVVRLTTSHRFGGAIGALATAIRAGDGDAVVALLRAAGPGVSFAEAPDETLTTALVDAVRERAERAGVALVRAARTGDVAGALEALESHRLLVAHRRGPFGVSRWAAQVEAWVAEAAGPDPDGRTAPWYPGRPLVVTANDRDTGLYNGDTGVLVAGGDGHGLVAAFGDPSAPTLVRPHRLPAVETVHATTVHRGQGSQFASVTVLLPPPASPLLTRELLYTAVTRAREQVRLLGSEAAVRAAVGRAVRRASGLREPLRRV